MTAEERVERLDFIQEQTQALYRMLTSRQLTTEEGRVGLDLLQLLADTVDLSDAIARRTQAGRVTPPRPDR